MRYIKQFAITVVLAAQLLVIPVYGDEVSCQIAGLIGLDPVTPNSYAAIWVPLADGQAVAGLRWFNNDSEVVYPAVLVASGVEDEPANATDAETAALSQQGPSRGWVEIQFDQQYVCTGAGVYCMIELPLGSEYSGLGYGGGAAFAYYDGECGFQGWLGGDEGTWIKIDAATGLAIEPIIVGADPDAIVMKSMGRDAGYAAGKAMLLGGFPNPFNPQTVLQYSLPRSANVELSIYDLKGKLVKTLVSGQQEAGEHSVAWRGIDTTGRRAPSGVYFARFATGSIVQTHRLMLVK